VSPTVTKTLQATFAPPTAHKQSKLNDLLETYRDGLQEAFDAGASTMSAVSNIVTPYDLPYQAKAALCNYVPKLRKTYNAKELDDSHPIRLTNQAAKFDHSEERDYEFTWWVPRPGRGTNFWIPLRINPEQEALWHDLVSEDAKAGEIRLQQHRQNWVLHVTVEYPVEEPTTDGDATHIGLDIGETALITGCALKDGSPTDPFVCSGSYGKYMNRRLHSWAFARLQGRIEDKATEAGIPVEYVNPAYTSQTCHSCHRIGRRNSQAEFRCPNDDCHISTFQADINASANIARRVDPWGESVPLDKAERDDSPRDGSGCDTATTPTETTSSSRGHERRDASLERHREKSAPAQMTLTAYEESKPSTSDD